MGPRSSSAVPVPAAGSTRLRHGDTFSSWDRRRVVGAHQHVHKGYLSPCQQPAAAGAHAFYCDSFELGGTPVGATSPLTPHHLAHRAELAAVLQRRAGGEVPLPGSPLPSCAPGLLQVLRLVAGRGTGDRGHCRGGWGGWTDGRTAAQAPSSGLSQAVLSASRESHQQPAAICALAARPGERCLQKFRHPGLG